MSESRPDDLDPVRLANLAIDALERTAMVIADIADEDDADMLPPLEEAACVDYEGPCRGRVWIAASDGFGASVAASLLGIDPSEVPADQAGAMIDELANILGGSVILDLGGDDCPFRLGLPRRCPTGECPTSDQCTRIVLDAEGERLEVRWQPLAA
jgi:hypothetical protein